MEHQHAAFTDDFPKGNGARAIDKVESVFSSTNGGSNLWELFPPDSNDTAAQQMPSCAFDPLQDARLELFAPKHGAPTALEVLSNLTACPGLQQLDAKGVLVDHGDISTPSDVFQGLAAGNPTAANLSIRPNPFEHNHLLAEASNPCQQRHYGPCQSPDFAQLPCQKFSGTPDGLELGPSCTYCPDLPMPLFQCSTLQPSGGVIHSPPPPYLADAAKRPQSAPQVLHHHEAVCARNLFLPGNQQPPPPPPRPGQRNSLPRHSSAGGMAPGTPASGSIRHHQQPIGHMCCCCGGQRIADHSVSGPTAAPSYPPDDLCATSRVSFSQWAINTHPFSGFVLPGNSQIDSHSYNLPTEQYLAATLASGPAAEHIQLDNQTLNAFPAQQPLLDHFSFASHAPGVAALLADAFSSPAFSNPMAVHSERPSSVSHTFNAPAFTTFEAQVADSPLKEAAVQLQTLNAVSGDIFSSPLEEGSVSLHPLNALPQSIFDSPLGEGELPMKSIHASSQGMFDSPKACSFHPKSAASPLTAGNVCGLPANLDVFSAPDIGSFDQLVSGTVDPLALVSCGLGLTSSLPGLGGTTTPPGSTGSMSPGGITPGPSAGSFSPIGPNDPSNHHNLKNPWPSSAKESLLMPPEAPDTPTAAAADNGPASRSPLGHSRLRYSSSGGSSSGGSSSGASSRRSSFGGAAPAGPSHHAGVPSRPSRLSSMGGANSSGASKPATVTGKLANAMSPQVPAVSTASAKPPAAMPLTATPNTKLMYMAMHDDDCSSYCLGGSLEPHKCWFGVGLHRAIRKLVTNNKKRHSLILALHAAGDGLGWGDLAAVYRAVAQMHNNLQTAGWATEAGAKLWAGVEELMELLETALREGPGNADYVPPVFVSRRRA